MLSQLHEILVECGQIIRSERASLNIQLKGPDDLVTNADAAAEIFLRASLTQLLPGSSVWGEEEGYSPPAKAGWWVVDPIDGTVNFSYGSPLWGVSVGLVQAEKLVLGGVYLPDFEEMYLGAAGEPSTMNGEPLKTIEPGPVLGKHAVCANSSLFSRNLRPRFGHLRATGSFVTDAMFTVRGRFRGMYCYGEHLYDAAGSIIVARGVGMEIVLSDGSAFEEGKRLSPTNISEPWAILPKGAKFELSPFA